MAASHRSLIRLSLALPKQSVLAHCRSRVIALRRSITGAHFEDEHTGPLSDGDSQYQGMAELMLDLKRVLLQVKHKQFIDWLIGEF